MILLGQVEKINRNFIYKETAVKTIAVVRKVQVTNIYLCVGFFLAISVILFIKPEYEQINVFDI